MSDRFDAIIIGAGAAGLSAARDLSGAGRTLCIVEARERTGGRIRTLHDRHHPLPIELGAEFIHGEEASTLPIARMGGLLVVRLPDDHWWSRRGRLQPRENFWTTVERVLAKVPTNARDLSFAEFLKRQRRLDARTKRLAMMFVEGYHAAHADRISAASLRVDDPDSEPPKQFRIATGYDGIIEWLLAGLDPDRASLRLGDPVTEIAWRRGTVEVKTARGAHLRAKAAIVTIPLGVWKSPERIRFDPPLRAKQNAIARLEVGHVVKIVFRFRRPFWGEERNFVHSDDRFMPTWWTAAPFRDSTLTGWAGGHAADALLAEGPAAIVDRALDSMAATFAVRRKEIEPQLESMHMHDWQADPFSRGAYSYAGVGGAHAHDALAKPVASTLFFAGEATIAEQNGTVAGAIDSGRRAARECLRSALA